MFDDFGECLHFTSDHAQSARHRLHGFQRGHKLTDPIWRARDDEYIEERVELAYFRRGYAAGEHGRPGQPGPRGLALQGGAFGPVAHDQGPGWHAASAQDRGRLEQSADPLVRDQAGHLADHRLIRTDTQLFAEGGRVGQRLEEFRGYGVRHDFDLLRRDATGHD